MVPKVWFGLFLGLLIGCAEQKPVVKGRVTLDGNPVESGMVQFFPEDNKNPSGKPGKIENGTYTAVGVPVGKMRIVINAPIVVGKKKASDLPESPMIDEMKESIPDKYNTNSTLFRDIEPGVNVFDFELTTK